jgi:hypothetical protein
VPLTPSGEGSLSLSYLLALLHCCFCNHWSCFKLKLAVVALPVVIYSTAAAVAGGVLRGGRCGSLTHAAASPERLRLLLWRRGGRGNLAPPMPAVDLVPCIARVPG